MFLRKKRLISLEEESRKQRLRMIHKLGPDFKPAFLATDKMNV